MKMLIKKITLHSFKNFQELTYKVGSGQIYGRSGEGKTNLLNAIAACFVNSGMDGKKTIPLPDTSNSGWVKIDYELDGDYQEVYRTWTRTDTGFTSATSITKTVQKSLFLAMLNPLYIFGLENSERMDFLIDLKYFDYTGDLFSLLPPDVGVDIMEFAKEHGKLTIQKLRLLKKSIKDEIKSKSSVLHDYNVQIATLENVENTFEILCDIKSSANALEIELSTKHQELQVIEKINAMLLNIAIDSMNKSLTLTQFSEDGKIAFCNTPSDRLSSGEKIECGLEIANFVASTQEVVPPTLIDNAASNGHAEVDITAFPNLSQIITASFANVDLCEYANDTLYGMDKSWKTKPQVDFRPEVKLEFVPFN